MRLTVFDGVGVIGGNKILLETQRMGLLLDFGDSFSALARYFEEYLQPRSKWGLLDLIDTGVLPPIRGIYREDLMPPGMDLWDRVSRRGKVASIDRVDAILLSHAHLDHAGSISYLRHDIPVLTSTVTAAIVKAYQDSGRGGFLHEFCYASPKEPKGTSGILGLAKTDPIQRPFRVLDGAWTAEASRFWAQSPWKNKALSSRPVEHGLPPGFPDVRAFPVDHSVPGCLGFAVETEAGWVAYTGDIRVHGHQGDATRRFAAEAARLRPLILLTEGTRVTGGPAPTEGTVFERCLSAVQRASGKLVLADFGPRNVERLLSFHQIAKETGRRLVVTAKDAYLLEALRAVGEEVPDVAGDEHVLVYDEPKDRYDGWEEGILERLAVRLVTAKEIRHEPGSFLLAFGFFEINRLIDIDPPEGGVYIYSNSELYDDEMRIDFQRLRNWLDRFGFTLVGDPTLAKSDPDHWGYHASGHIAGTELLPLLRDIRPRYLVPVHTEQPQWFVEALHGTGIEVVLPVQGWALEMVGGDLRVKTA